MDKRKGIILAIVLFLFIGLGTFVFAGNSQNNENGPGTNTSEPSGNGGNSGQDGSSGEPAGNQKGEGGQDTDGTDNNQSGQDGLANELPASSAEEQPGEEPAGPGTPTEEPDTPSEPETQTVDYSDLLAKLSELDGLITKNTINANLSADDLANLANLDYSLELDGDELTSFDLNELTDEGEYVLTVNVSGEERTFTFAIDETPIEVRQLYLLNNTHNDYNVSTENRYKVIGNGQDLYVEYVLEEEFTSTPVITIGGKEFTMTCGTASWDDSLFKCDAHITITEDMNLIDGDVIPFTITGVLDEALNETVVDEDDIRDNATKGYSKVVYDNSAPESNWVYILNTLEGSHTVIGNEQKLLVEINVNECNKIFF